jgi:formylglycine-generating enzyme required for sulfatase activity/tRNA A-37 threonylcarbamoyl transferase component Bud32
MPSAAVADFLEALRGLPLLDAGQRDQLDALQRQFGDIQLLSQELVRRGWLTDFQVNHLVRGQGQDLLLDQYVLLDLLGQGGMGTVYVARQSRMKRQVALKVIRPETLNAPGAAERFQREAEATARLSHPNIVTVHDANQVKGVHFLVMELLDGTDLAKLVQQQGPLPVGQACEYVRQAALGLQHAHEQGLVHRDVKPHNLMLTKQGIVKVMDLGLARHSSATNETSGLTATGSMMGTPYYMAPEQALDAKSVDVRADIYSLGSTLYHLLAGQPPFTTLTLPQIVAAHVRQTAPQPIEQLRGDLPAELRTALRRMMAHAPGDRYRDPAAVAAALTPFADTSSSHTPLLRRQAGAGPLQSTIGTSLPTESSRTVTLPEQPAAPRRASRMLLALVLLAALGLVGWRYRATLTTWAERFAQRLTAPTTEPLSACTEGQAITNAIGMKLMPIPAGQARIGSPEDEVDRSEDEVLHEVEIGAPFYLSSHPVTQEQFARVMGKNPSYFSPDGEGKDLVQDLDTQGFPVESVTWQAAQEFCRKLSDLPEEKEAGRTYRLPTEVEWEYACRAGTTTPFHFGASLSSRQANFNGNFPYGDGKEGPFLQRPTAVGSYPSNAFGLYDMHGNVWQWCADDYALYPTDPRKGGAVPQPGSTKVARGGSWNMQSAHCRSAYRSSGEEGATANDRGFRVVMTVAPQAP